jgi:hypothetical protein
VLDAFLEGWFWHGARSIPLPARILQVRERVRD